MQQWKAMSAGTPNIACTRSMTCGCRVVSTEPIPRARAASRMFCTAGNVDAEATPEGSENARMTAGAFAISSARRAGIR